MTADFTAWGRQPEYSLWEAAFLFCDMEPMQEKTPKLSLATVPDAPQLVVSMTRRLIDEVPHREVHQPMPPGRPVLCNRFFKRQDLLDWANRTGQRPKFLFPDDTSDNLDPRMERTNLQIIRALALECGLDLSHPHKAAETLQAMAARPRGRSDF